MSLRQREIAWAHDQGAGGVEATSDSSPTKLVLLVIFVVVGVAATQAPKLALWVRILVPFGALAAITTTLWLWRASTKTRIVVDEVGITRHGLFRVRNVAWCDIEEYRYLSVKQPIHTHSRGGAGLLGLIGGALAELNAQRRRGPRGYFGLGYIDLHACGAAAPFRIGKDPFWGPQGGYNDITDLVELIVNELHQRLVTDDFTPFTLARATLQHADGREIPYAEIARVHLGAGKIVVMSGQPLKAWSRTPMQHVHNSLLLLRRLAQRGVPISLASEVFVPQSVLKGE